MINIKDQKQIKIMREGGEILKKVMDALKEEVKPGISTEYLDELASQLIKKYENHQRGLYSGLIGWFNFDNEGEFVIAIRSALLIGKRIFAYAGCGIVQDSDPATEFEETELKLKPILSLFR